MARTKNYNYFKAFIEMADCGRRSSRELKDLLSNEEGITQIAENIRQIESEADSLNERIVDEVNHSFITPIDREDVVVLADVLDTVVDGVEDVANLMDIYSITKITKEAQEFGALILEATEVLFEIAVIFENFKNYKELNAGVKKLKALEEQGDTLFHVTMKALMTEQKDPIEVIKWKNIYEALEATLNNCDRAAKSLRGAALKNS